MQQAKAGQCGDDRVCGEQPNHPHREQHKPIRYADCGGRCDEDGDLGRTLNPDTVQNPDAGCRAGAIPGVGVSRQRQFMTVRVVMPARQQSSTAQAPSTRGNGGVYTGCLGRCVRMVVGVRRLVSECAVVLMLMLVFDLDRAPRSCSADFAKTSEGAIDHEHPAAAQTKVTALARQLDKDPGPESDERRTDDATHPFVQPIGYRETKADCDRPQREDRCTVAQRVDHGQEEAPAPAVCSAAEVGDSRDVVPVEPMAQPKGERCQQEPQTHITVYRKLAVRNNPRTWPCYYFRRMVWNENELTLTCETTSTEHLLQVATPFRYDSLESAPLILCLDGAWVGGTVRDATRIMSMSGESPEAVVASLSFTDDTMSGYLQSRARWFCPTHWVPPVETGVKGVEPEDCGYASVYLDFIASQVLPALHDDYRISQLWLVGHSFSALFGLYTLFHKPDLFDKYVLASPSIWWDDRVMLDIENDYAVGHDDLTARVFLSAGADEDVFGGQFNMRGNVIEMADRLGGRGYANLEVSHVILPVESHSSTIGAAVSRGIRTLLR